MDLLRNNSQLSFNIDRYGCSYYNTNMGSNIRKIILVATDNQGKNLVFVDDLLQAYPLEKAIELAKGGKLDNVCIAKRSGVLYLRTKPNTPAQNRLDKISISSYRLFSSVDNIDNALLFPGFKNYWQKYQSALSKEGADYIIIDGHSRIDKEAVKTKLQPCKDLIFEAAKKFNIDPYILAAIIIDEIARFGPIENITDPLKVYFLGINASMGIAQVKIETARSLIKSDYYNPDPDKLSPNNIDKISRQQLCPYVEQLKNNIYFTAAKIRSLIDEWKKSVDLNKRPEIIATLYRLNHKIPHSDPQPDSRGQQIAGEFYKLARKWLQ